MSGAGRAKSSDKLLSLPRGFLILLALKEGPANGLELGKRILGDTMGRYLVGGAFYEELNVLEQSGWIDRDPGKWQRVARLTPEGERALKLRVKDLEQALDVA